MEFRSLYRHGFARVAACVPRSAVADPAANAEAVLALARQCHEQGVALAVFPELCLSGYAIEDLLQQEVLLAAVEGAVADLARATAELHPVLLVGAPLVHRGRLFNAAVALHRGRILGVVPKIHLPTYREFYERRHFVSGDGVTGETIQLAGQSVPFGTDLVFEAADLPGFALHVEICEDVWIPVPPSSEGALAGATVLANLSGSPITIGRAEARNLLCRAQSGRCLAAYVYAAAGAGESTTDLSWDGHASIHENGTLLAESGRFSQSAVTAVADVDLGMLRQERLLMGTFDDNARRSGRVFRRVSFALAPPEGDLGLRRRIERFPFVPSDPARLEADCYEGYNIQVSGLVQRLRASGIGRVVIGVSGGLDSTHALIVACKAMDLLGRPRTDILGYTLPGFATSDGTKGNAIALMAALGITPHELDIRPASRQMLADLGHPFAQGESVYDITFENVQAGLRTDYLFRLANHQDAIVLGTGDLSELALGWCTYGVGDQMSHYNVNAGVPKTLIQHLIRWVIASGQESAEANAVLGAILARRSRPNWCPATRRRARRPRSGPTSCRISRCFTCCGTGSRRRRSPSWRGMPGTTRRRGTGPATSRWTGAGPTPGRDPALDGGVPPALLRIQPVQAIGDAEWPEGERRRLAVAARRLAGALGRQRPHLAGRAGAERPPGGVGGGA